MLHLRKRFDRSFKGYNRIWSMQLIDVDAIKTKPFQAAFDGNTQVSWTCVVRPLIGAGPVPPALGGNDQPRWDKETELRQLAPH
jgi:hypothetical protein